MTESERVARELLAYRDNPPVRQAGLVEGQWYESGDILWIIMAPRCEFTTYELLTRLAELMGCGTCKLEQHGSLADQPSMVCWSCSECGFGWHHSINDKQFRYCPNCGREVVE